MKIQIHARNAELAEDFREIAEEKLNSMERFGVVIDRVEVEVLHVPNILMIFCFQRSSASSLPLRQPSICSWSIQ